MTIPKTIHYVWFGGSRKDALSRRCIESWKRILPSYTIKEWNETNSPMGSLYMKEALKQKRWSKLSNYVRLFALYHEGGLYFDTDVEVLKSFDPLLKDDLFLGFQQKKEAPDWVNNAVIGAIRGHDFLKRCMDFTLEQFAKKGNFCLSPHVTTKVLKEKGLHGYGLQKIENIMLYPYEYFYPFPWRETFHPSCITKDTYCVHHWNISWISPFARMKSKVRKSVEKKLDCLGKILLRVR